MKNPLKEVIQGEIDLREAWDLVSQREVIVKELKRLRININEVLFRGVNGENKKEIMIFGSTKPNTTIIHCSTTQEFLHGEESASALNYALDYDEPALAIYDAKKLYLCDDGGGYGYKPEKGFNFRDCLLAFFFLKNTD